MNVSISLSLITSGPGRSSCPRYLSQTGSRFKEVGCAQAFLPQDPIRAQLDPPERTQFRSERILGVGRVLNVNTRVILEVTTYLAHIRYHINPMLAERICVSHTGEHQQFG